MSEPAACVDRTRGEPRPVQVGDIARAHGAALRHSYALTPDQHAVLRGLERCRTAALGGHMHVCDSCGYAVPMYNSCRNRHCPTCQSLEQHKWLERRRETILPVPYFHLVFTLPSELRTITRMNPERVFALMFQAASQTVLLLSQDKKRLGGTPALTMVLHTWTRELTFHPHVHAIVSAGALRPDGVWLRSRQAYLFPVKVMARLFRRLFREALLEAIDAGQLSVVAEQQADMRRALFETKWHVYAKAPFGGADQVYSYLGRYTHRVGISNARILRADEHAVTFATKNGRTCTLTPVEFLRRFLLHVLPKGFHKLRHYGLCSSHHIAQGTIATLRNTLGTPTADSAPTPTGSHDLPVVTVMDGSTPPQTWLECMLALTGLDVLRCPRCAQGRMVRVALELASDAPNPDTS